MECYRCFSHSSLDRGFRRILLDDLGPAPRDWDISLAHTSMAVIFFILLIVSLTQDWTRGVHSYFGMTKDPQPGSGKYGAHTFCSRHACMALISLLY